VASGSSVPQWPTFLMPSLRRTIATTSCDVILGALSTSRTPSTLVGSILDFVADHFQHLRLDARKVAADARAGGERVPAATVTHADFADIDARVFRAQAHADFAFGEFLEKRGDDHALDRADVIDEALVVLGLGADLAGDRERQPEAGHAAVAREFQNVEQRAQQLDA